MTTKTTTTQYYEIADFEMYQSIFDETTPIEKFVDSINYICNETDGDKNLEVCEFMKIMKQIETDNRDLSTNLKSLMNKEDENNTYSVYIYLKFLLLSNEEKGKFIRYIDRLEYIEECMSDITLVIEPMENLLKMMFEINDDDYFNNFLDYKDNYGNYRRLDFTTISYDNITNAQQEYMELDFIIKFVFSIRIFFCLKFLIQLIYLISYKNQTKILKEGETSISSIEDFIRRFEYNIDTFIILYNFNVFMYKPNTIDLSNLKQFLSNIPCDKIVVNCVKNEFEDCDQREKMTFIRFRLFAMYISYSYKTEWSIFNTSNEIDDTSIVLFLKTKYGDDICIDDDINRIRRYINYNKIHSEVLYKRYTEYFESKIYQSLNTLSPIMRKLSDVCNVELPNITDIDREELFSFIGKIYETFHYSKFFRY